MMSNWNNPVFAGMVGSLIVIGIVFAIIVISALYVYHSLAWVAIARKMKYKKAWLAWIPFAGSSMRLQLGKFHWAWIFLILIPIAGWIALGVLLTISSWRIFEKLGHPGWLSLSIPLMFIPFVSWIGFIAYFVTIGIVAWKK